MSIFDRIDQALSKKSRPVYQEGIWQQKETEAWEKQEIKSNKKYT